MVPKQNSGIPIMKIGATINPVDMPSLYVKTKTNGAYMYMYTMEIMAANIKYAMDLA